MFIGSRFILGLVIVSTLAAPEVAVVFKREPVAVVDLAKTAVFADAARSTSLLPFELSAVRLRGPELGNRTGLQG